MNGYMEQILNKIRKLKKKHIIMAVAVFILLIILIVFIGHIQEKVYKEMMKDINNFKEEFIVNIGHGNSIQTVNKTMKEGIKLLSLNKDVTGVFACNDLMAIGIMNACKKLNIKIPNDLSIVGYDNIELSEMVEPKLTTIDQNMFLLGKNSAILLNEKIENNNKYSKSIVLNNHLIKRDT